jgi:hypothetical protein
MTAAVGSLKQASRSLIRGWHRFFHAPCDARIAAAVRIAFAIVTLLNLAVLYPDLDHWFTDQGVLPAEVSREVARPYAWSVLWLLPSTPAVVHACYWIAVAQTVLLLVGVVPRLQALGVFVWLVSFTNRNYLIVDGEDTVFRLIAFFLIWMPVGRCWSVDALVRRWWQGPHLNPLPEGEGVRDPRPSPLPEGEQERCAAPGWGLRLLQIQMCLMFLSAGLCKLDGNSWLNGTAIYYVARLDDYFGRFAAPDWPFDWPWAVALLTWSVIAIELLVPIFVWFRETRRLCLVAVVLFHLGNEWTMHLFLFHWVMLAGWLAFVEPSDFAWLSGSGIFGARRASIHDDSIAKDS